MYRVNRYCRGSKWYWRVWRGAALLARGAHGYTSYDAMERDLRRLFPHFLKVVAH